MKIAFTLGILNRGGTESLMLDLCRKKGVAPFDFVVIYRKEGQLSTEFQKTDANLIKCSKRRSLLDYMWRFRQIVLREHIDIVHAQTAPDAVISIFSLFGTSVSTITTRHGFDLANTRPLLRWFVFKFCKKICFVSNYEKDYYVHKMHLDPHNPKYHVVYNGMDFNKLDLKSESEKESVCERVNYQLQPRLCMVGNFNEVRTQNIIIEAINILNESGVLLNHSFQFYFIGGAQSELYNLCNQLTYKYNLSDVIIFLGSRGDVPQLLRAMDGFVYSSHKDTFGIGVLEAMASGLPIVCNDFPVMAEITNNGEWATLFSTDDVEDCANKIQDLIMHLPERKAKAQEIAQKVREKYSIEQHIKRLSEIYSK